MERMTISLPGIPPSLNKMAGRQNVWEYRQAKQEWTMLVYAYCKACKGRPKEPWNKAAVEIVYYFPDKRRRDADNYCGKFLLDGLTEAGVIVDDSMFHITLTIRGELDRKSPHTEIIVTKKEK